MLCIFCGSLFTSTAGILVRWVEVADAWPLLFYRSLALVVVLLGSLALRYRRGLVGAFRDVGRPGLVLAPCLGTAFIAFILALLETSVAQVVFIVGASPFFAAGLAWLVLRERVAPGLWLAMAAAFAGIAVMMGEGLGGGSLAGALWALLACLGYSSALVAMRRRRTVDMLPAICLAGLVALAVSFLLADNLAIGPRDLTIALTLGAVQLGLQYILLTAGARHVPAAEIALVARISVVLAPLWVWIGVGEVPSEVTLLGGAIVLSAILGHGLYGLRRP